MCVVPQGCDPAGTDSSSSAWSHLAVWSSGPSVCGDSLCLHRSQRLPGRTQHIYDVNAAYMYIYVLHAVKFNVYCATQFDSTLKTIYDLTVLVV